MNDQTTTIKVRKANKISAVGEHYTVTRVIREPGDTRCFGFGVSDDGKTEVYIPALIIKTEQMTEADIGAGFTAGVRRGTGHENGGHPQVMHPVKWDGEAEEMEVPVAQSAPDAERPEEFDELLLLCESLLDNTSGPIEQMVDRLDQLTKGAGILFSEAKKLRDQLVKFRIGLDNIAPEQD